MTDLKLNKKVKKSNRIVGTKIFQHILLGCFLSAAVAALIFIVSYTFMTGYMKGKEENPRSIELKKQQAFYELQSFVARHNLSTGDVNEIRLWQLERGVALEVLGTKETVAQKEAILEPYCGSILAAFAQQISEREEPVYEVRFRDVTILCNIILKQDKGYEKICMYISLVLAMVTFVLVFMLFIRPRIRYVIQLLDEISHMTGDGLVHPITVSGKDELAQLGKEMNLVRQSVIGKIQDEREAITANQELITAMSHDLRTPLTRQIGYLEILYRNKYQGEQELTEYIEKARSNAFIMKDTTDKLFRYFLAFGKPESKEEQMEVEGKPLFNSVLKEQVAYIVSQGFVVSYEEVTQPFLLKIQADDFARVFDNIFHNLKKYGEIDVPVHISSVLQDGEFLLMVQNGIKQDTTNVESTKVGLKIVDRIMKSMGGSLEVMNDGQYFIIQLVFKVSEIPNTQG